MQLSFQIPEPETASDEKPETFLKPDGCAGDMVRCYCEPLEFIPGTVRVRVAEPGKEYMTAWEYIDVWRAQCKIIPEEEEAIRGTLHS